MMHLRYATAIMPVVAHHPGTYYAYIYAWVLASAAWDRFFGGPGPLDPAAGRALRRVLLEAAADKPPAQVRQLGLTSASGKTFCLSTANAGASLLHSPPHTIVSKAWSVP